MSVSNQSKLIPWLPNDSWHEYGSITNLKCRFIHSCLSTAFHAGAWKACKLNADTYSFSHGSNALSFERRISLPMKWIPASFGSSKSCLLVLFNFFSVFILANQHQPAPTSDRGAGAPRLWLEQYGPRKHHPAELTPLLPCARLKLATTTKHLELPLWLMQSIQNFLDSTLLHLTPAWLCRPSSWLLPASVAPLAAEICNWTGSNLCPICPGLYRLDWLFAILPPDMQHRLHLGVSSFDVSATSESISTTGTFASNTAIAADSCTVHRNRNKWAIGFQSINKSGISDNDSPRDTHRAASRTSNISKNHDTWSTSQVSQQIVRVQNMSGKPKKGGCLQGFIRFHQI